MDGKDGFLTLAGAYEGIENEGAFSDLATLESYRAAVLRKTDPQLAFLRSRLPSGGRLVEVGCGNGRLAIALSQAAMIGSALGLDLAQSRIAFARSWTADLGMNDRLEFKVSNTLDYELNAGEYSIAACITGTLAYFDAYIQCSSKLLLKHLQHALMDGGLLVLELYPHPRERRLLEQSNGHIKTWTELPPEDPWRFYLSDLQMERNDILVHSKTFVHRSSGQIDGGRSERLVLYTPETISKLLHECGFSDIRCHEGWSGDLYAGGELMVITALAQCP